MGYLDSSDAELISLTRQRRRERNTARIAALPPTMRFSAFARTYEYKVRIVAPKRPKRTAQYRKPLDALHGFLPPKIFLTLWRLQSGKCYLCGRKFTETNWATCDHVTPRSRGGEDGGNLLLAHGPCNNRKADRDPTEGELAYLLRVNGGWLKAYASVEAA